MYDAQLHRVPVGHDRTYEPPGIKTGLPNDQPMSVRPEEWADLADTDLSGHRVLVTGSTDGIGRKAALALGRLGAHVLVHGRSREKADRLVSKIESAGGTADGYTADFASLDRVREFATTVRDDVDRIDVLANNAGTYFREHRETDVGVDATFVVNHLAPFLLTHRLLPAIPDGGRIVTTASSAHRGVDLDPDSFGDRGGDDWFTAYGRSKLANVLFARELARRLEDRTSNCFHPGLIPGSSLWRHSQLHLRVILKGLALVPNAVTRHVFDTPATGAATLVYLAAATQVDNVTGEYFVDFEPRDPSPAARNDDRARQLWEWSENAAGLDSDERLR